MIQFIIYFDIQKSLPSLIKVDFYIHFCNKLCLQRETEEGPITVVHEYIVSPKLVSSSQDTQYVLFFKQCR